MAIVFPASPTLNDTFIAGSITYQCVQVNPNKWIGLGVTPSDRLIEGSNKLEIDGSNQLVWSGDDIIQSSANKSFKSNSTSSGDYVRMYAGGGTAQWDIYGNGELLRMGDNSSSATAKVQFDNPTLHRSTSITPGVAAVTAKQEVNNGGYLLYDGRNSSDTTVFSVTHNGRVAVSDGIDFSSNANAAGMSSELLDDYEEGVWTPAWGSTTGSFTSVTYATQSGRYTKIGNRVFIDCRLRSSATTIGTAGGGLLVTGLPFTCTTSQGTGGAAAYSLFDFSNTGLFYSTETRENTTQFYAALGTRDNNTFFNEGPGSLQGSGNSEIRVQFCYKTDD